MLAPPAGLKSAYRSKALRIHPDVSDAPDAAQRFAELSEAYGEDLSGATFVMHEVSGHETC